MLKFLVAYFWSLPLLNLYWTPAIWSLNYSLEFLVWTWFLLLALRRVQNEWENILLSSLRQSASLIIAYVILSCSYLQSTEKKKNREVTVTLQVSQVEVISESKKKENLEQIVKSYGAGWCTGGLKKSRIQRQVTFFRECSALKYILLSLWNVMCSLKFFCYIYQIYTYVNK